MPAALIAAGLDGLVQKRDLGTRSDANTYSDAPAATVKRLPQNLLDALRCLEANSSLRDRLGKEAIAAYLKLKYQEWSEYSGHLSRWELDRTLDC